MAYSKYEGTKSNYFAPKQRNSVPTLILIWNFFERFRFSVEQKKKKFNEDLLKKKTTWPHFISRPTTAVGLDQVNAEDPPRSQRCLNCSWSKLLQARTVLDLDLCIDFLNGPGSIHAQRPVLESSTKWQFVNSISFKKSVINMRINLNLLVLVNLVNLIHGKLKVRFSVQQSDFMVY